MKVVYAEVKPKVKKMTLKDYENEQFEKYEHKNSKTKTSKKYRSVNETKCEICNEKFALPEYLLLHNTSVHEGQKIIVTKPQKSQKIVVMPSKDKPKIGGHYSKFIKKIGTIEHESEVPDMNEFVKVEIEEDDQDM